MTTAVTANGLKNHAAKEPAMRIGDRQASLGAAGPAADILELQSAAGNWAFSALLGAGHTIPSATGALLQRSTCQECAAGGECEACRQRREATLQRAGSETGTGFAAGEVAPPIVHSVLHSSGRPLEPSIQTAMGMRFGYDFGGVRVHADPRAGESAAAVGALAYTVGQHVVFGKGQYSPDSVRGQQLLAHELTHVVQQRGAAIPGSIRIGPHDGAAEHEAHQVGIGARRRAMRASRPLLQRVPTPQCIRLLNQPGRSDPLTGFAIQRQILNHFRRRVGRPVRFSIPDASAAPLRTEGRESIIPPQIIGSAQAGLGHPDLAYKRRGGSVMLLAEIKPANWFGFAFAENQLLNYINKGNSPENADLRQRLGVRVFAPMLPSTYRPPRIVRIGRRRFRVMWCGPGIIVYKEIGRRRRRRRRRRRQQRRRQTTQRRQQDRRRGTRTRRRSPRGRAGGQAGVANFGLGLSLFSTGGGAANVGIGVSIMSQGVSVGTVSAGVVYNSEGVAIGTIGAGAAAESQSATAGAAGAGVSRQSTTAGAGVAGAGTAERTTGAAAGVAGAGRVRDVSGTAVGQARTGDVEGARGDAGAAPEGGVPGDRTAAGERAGGADAGVPGGVREGTGREGEGAGDAGVGGDRGQTGTQPTTGEGGRQEGATAARNLADIVARLRLDIPESNPRQVEQLVVDAARLDALVTQASSAQVRLLRILASANPDGVYAVPSPAWIEMILTATAGISEADLDYLATLEWEPARADAAQLRRSIERALSRRRRAEARQRQREQQRQRSRPPRGGEAEAERRGGAGRQEARGSRRRTRGEGEGERGRGRRGRRSALASVSMRDLAAALSAANWTNVDPGAVLIDFGRTPPLLRGRTEKGTRFGAFIEIGVVTEEGQRSQVVTDATDVLILDNAREGDSLPFGMNVFFATAGAPIEARDLLIGLVVGEE